MNKNKGFTLVELIGVIVLLAILALVTTPTVNRIIKEQKEKAYNIQLNMVLNAAKQYTNDNSETLDIPNDGLVLKISDLYNSGYLDKDKVINPKTKEEFNKCILVKWNSNDNQYNYEYSDSCRNTEYTPLEYVKTTGNQYIDTGYTPTNNTKIEMSISFNNFGRNQTFYLARANYSINTYTMFLIAGGSSVRSDYYNSQIPYNITFEKNQKYKVYQDSNKIYIDDTLIVTQPTANFTAGGNLYLLASYVTPYSTFDNGAYANLYYTKIWDGDNLVRDFIPVKDKDDKVCLYDMINKTYYYSKSADFLEE